MPVAGAGKVKVQKSKLLQLKFNCTQAKVPYFFISREKFNFCHFWSKIEWASENVVFFQCCIFFSGSWIWVSEWTLNFSWKKNTQFFWEKKFPSKIRKVPKNSIKYLFLTFFFADIRFFSSEWLTNFSWEKK